MRTTSLALAFASLSLLGCDSGSSKKGSTAAPVTSSDSGKQTGPLPAFQPPTAPPAGAAVAYPYGALVPGGHGSAGQPAPARSSRPLPSRTPVRPPLPVDPDPDRDGLTNAEELFFGTNPIDPDTDKDGILDGQDLAPLYGAAGYGPFQTVFPTGMLHRGVELEVLGLAGRSKIEHWFGDWRSEYEGAKGTRSSDMSQANVVRQVRRQFAHSDYYPQAITALGKPGTAPAYVNRPAPPEGGPAPGTGQRFRQQVVHKRYTIDYGFVNHRQRVSLRNRSPKSLRDQTNRVLSNRTFQVRVEGGQKSTVVIQVAIQRNADKTRETASEYTVPALLYWAFEGNDPLRAPLVAESLAIGGPLNEHAYEMRLPLAPQGPGVRVWSVVVTPVWIQRRGQSDPTLGAIDAGAIQIGAVAHSLELKSGDGREDHLLGIYAGLEGLLRDLRAAAARARFGPPLTHERKLIERLRDRWLVTLIQSASRIARDSAATILRKEVRAAWVEGLDLLSLLAPQDLARFRAVVAALLQRPDGRAVLEFNRAVLAQLVDGVVRTTLYCAKDALLGEALKQLGSLGFIPARFDRLRELVDRGLIVQGLAGLSAANNLIKALRTLQQNDLLKGGLFIGMVGKDVLRLLGKTEQANLLNGLLGGALGGLNAYRAFADGDVALGMVHVAKGSGALIKQFVKVDGVNVVGIVNVALAAVDVGYQLHKANQERDPIRRQAHIEKAATSAADAGIGMIPTVGPVLRTAWSVGFLAAAALSPEAARWGGIYASPGAFVTFLGTVFFTSEIPTTFSEIALEDAAAAFVRRAMELQTAGLLVTIVLPEGLNTSSAPPPASGAPAPRAAPAPSAPRIDRASQASAAAGGLVVIRGAGLGDARTVFFSQDPRGLSGGVRPLQSRSDAVVVRVPAGARAERGYLWVVRRDGRSSNLHTFTVVR